MTDISQVDKPAVAHLIERLLAAAESAAAGGALDRAAEMAGDVLAVDPGNPRAEQLLARVRTHRSVPGGHRAFISLIFSDIVRSTELASTAEPETVRELFRAYRRVATEAVEGLGGTVLQFQGDGVFACFGYPQVHDDDAQRAVLAGLRLVEGMAAARSELRRRYGTELSVRVGVHSGTVVVGGQDAADAWNIVGLNAHVAARLQGEADPDAVVVSDVTKELVEQNFEVVSLGSRPLKGVDRAVDLYRVLRARQSGRPSAGSPSQSGAVVGREEPRRTLDTAWNAMVDAAREAKPPAQPVVALRGPAGIGKSRLARDLSEKVRAAGGAVLEATCSSYHANIALWPIVGMLESRLGLYPDLAEADRIAEVERRLESAGLRASDVLPLLAPLLGLDATRWERPEIDALALRAETLKTLATWLARFAVTNPTLLLVEDLHWADPTTVELLSLIAAQSIPGVLVLVTSRDPMPGGWITPVIDVELTPLAPAECDELLDSVAGELTVDQRRLITERGAGNPLFVRELARSALAATPGEVLPPRLHELLAARIRAPGVDLRAAQMAAALGSVFDSGLLRELVGHSVAEAVAVLEGAGIVEKVGDLRGTSYRFSHVLLRDAAYETLVLDDRRTAHRSIARLLQAQAPGPGDLALVAQHFDLSGSIAECIPAYILAAEAAQLEASHVEAKRLLSRALELVLSVPESDDRDLAEIAIRMRRAMSSSSLFGYGYPEVFEDFRIADSICRRHPGRPEAVPAQVGIWSYTFVRGQLPAAREALAPLADSLEDVPWYAPEIKACMGYNAFYGGELADARRLLEEAWAGFAGRPDDAADTWWPLPNEKVSVTAVALACVSALEGRTREAEEWEERALSAAVKVGFPRGPFSVAFVASYMAWIRTVLGDGEGARHWGNRVLQVAARHRFDYFVPMGKLYSMVLSDEEPVPTDDLEQNMVVMELIGHRAFLASMVGTVARNHLYRGEMAEAIAKAGQAVSLAEESGELVHLPNLLRLRAQINAAAGGGLDDEVAQDLLSATEVGLAQGSLLLALRAANHLARLPAEQRPERWRGLMEQVVERFPPDSESPELEEALAILET